jgi:hypothetical protein
MSVGVGSCGMDSWRGVHFPGSQADQQRPRARCLPGPGRMYCLSTVLGADMLVKLAIRAVGFEELTTAAGNEQL